MAGKENDAHTLNQIVVQSQEDDRDRIAGSDYRIGASPPEEKRPKPVRHHKQFSLAHSSKQGDDATPRGLEFDSFTRIRFSNSNRFHNHGHRILESDEDKPHGKSHKRSKSGKSSKSNKSRARQKEKARREELELDGLATDDESVVTQTVFYKRPRVWIYAGPFLWTLTLCVITVLLKELAEDKEAGNLPYWRFTLFFGLLPPIFLITNYILLLIVWFFESQFFTTTNALYFIVALKSPARWVIMTLLLLPLYIPLFASQASLSQGAHTTYHRILSFLACLIIFATVNLFKVLIAKLLSSYFHSSTHFSKMQEALDKEYYLKILATPRQTGDTLMYHMQANNGKASQQEEQHYPSNNQAGGLMSKLSQPLKRSLTIMKNKASSLPNFLMLDNITENRAANLEAKKQGFDMNEHVVSPSGPTSPDSSLPTHSLHHTFEPPDPVPPTPIRNSESFVASPGAHIQRPSMPIPGRRAGSTIPSELLPNIEQQYPPNFRRFMSLHGNKIEAEEGPTEARPSLKRWNSDGGLNQGSATLSNTLLPYDLKHTPRFSDPTSRSSAAQRPTSQSSHPTEAKEGKSTRRSSNVSNSEVWGWKRRNERTPSVIKEELEPETPTKLPTVTEEMTNEQGIALVSTIHQVEKHIRKNQIGLPFMRQISRNDGNSEGEAKKLAFFIFWNVKPSFHRNYVTLEDLQPFLPARKAEEAFAMLDRNGDGQVTLMELRTAIQEVLNERENLSMQLRDTKSVVGTLELVIGIALHIIAVFFYLMIFGINIQQVWVLFTSVFVGFAFIFGNSIKNLFEAVLYLFVQHPFDVGDTLILDNGDRVTVEEIALSTLTMLRSDGVRLWVPMTLMVPKSCQNISRSDNKADSVKFLVDVGASAIALQEVDRQVGEFINSHDVDFNPSHSVQLTASADPLKVVLVISWQYSHNGVDGGRIAQSKSNLLQVVSDTLAELRIVNTQAPLKSYDQTG